MQSAQYWGETVLLIVEISATAAFALSGVLEAARKRLDAVGVCVVGFLAAFGGGTVRDLLLGLRPKDFDVATGGAVGHPGAVCAGNDVPSATAFFRY